MVRIIAGCLLCAPFVIACGVAPSPPSSADHALEHPFTGYGQEPPWQLRIDDAEMILRTGYGEDERRFSALRSAATADGVRYEATADGERLTVHVVGEICRDTMSGMPHPYRITIDIDDTQQQGCGGEPLSLLTGATWQVERMAGEAVIEDAAPTMEFLEEDQRVAGRASCNRFMGNFELTGEGLSFDTLATTSMACGEPIDTQERQYLALLDDVRRFDIDDAGRLVLHTGDGQTITLVRR